MQAKPLPINELLVEQRACKPVGGRGTRLDDGPFTAVHNHFAHNPRGGLRSPGRQGCQATIRHRMSMRRRTYLSIGAQNHGKPLFRKENRPYPHFLWITLCMLPGGRCAGPCRCTGRASGQIIATSWISFHFNRLSVERAPTWAACRRGTCFRDGFFTAVHNHHVRSPHSSLRSPAGPACQAADGTGVPTSPPDGRRRHLFRPDLLRWRVPARLP